MRPASELPKPFDTRAFTLGQGTDARLTRRRLLGDDLVRPTRGVRLHASHAAEFLDRAVAYQLAVPDSVISHITAAALWGFWLPLDLQASTDIHLTRPPGSRGPRRCGCIGHTGPLLACDIVRGRKAVVTGPERTWCDLAAVLELDELIIAGDFLLKRRSPFSTEAKLATAAAAMTRRRGCAAAREALLWIRPRTDSAKETELRLLLVRAGLPEPAVNCAILDGEGRLGDGGRYVEEPDMMYGKYKIALQYDGGHPISEAQRRRDIGRDEQIIELGWRVLRFTQQDLDDPWSTGPAAVARTRCALLERGWSPDPPKE